MITPGFGYVVRNSPPSVGLINVHAGQSNESQSDAAIVLVFTYRRTRYIESLQRKHRESRMAMHPPFWLTPVLTLVLRTNCSETRRWKLANFANVRFNDCFWSFADTKGKVNSFLDVGWKVWVVSGWKRTLYVWWISGGVEYRARESTNESNWFHNIPLPGLISRYALCLLNAVSSCVYYLLCDINLYYKLKAFENPRNVISKRGYRIDTPYGSRDTERNVSIN